MNETAKFLILLTGWFGSYPLVFFVVQQVTAVHVRAQNKLLNRARAYFLLGAQALESRNQELARQFLMRIRRIERLWQLGDSGPLRLAIFCKGIVYAVVAAYALRYITTQFITARPIMTVEQAVNEFIAEFGLTVIILFVPFLHALFWASMFEWTDKLLIVNSGDRLHRLIASPRGIILTGLETQRDHAIPNLDGLTAAEVLGVQLPVSRLNLSSARRRLAAKFHPDLFGRRPLPERRAAEEAMKRVNRPFDELTEKNLSM